MVCTWSIRCSTSRGFATRLITCSRLTNLFVLRSTPVDYLMPAVAISGGVSALGVAPWLALLLWKPVAVLAIFFAVRGYVRRMLAGLWARRAALVLGLFFGSFSVIYGSFGVLDDLLPGFQAWGYPFGLMALAALVGALLAYDRGRVANRLAWTPGLLGALASSLHPWQGELLILIVVGAELMLGRRGGRVRVPAGVACGDRDPDRRSPGLLRDPRQNRQFVAAGPRGGQPHVLVLGDRAGDRPTGRGGRVCRLPAPGRLHRRRDPHVADRGVDPVQALRDGARRHAAARL